MCLACLGREEREEWMAIMRDCRRITYENALLGDAMIEKLNSASSQLVAEKEMRKKAEERTLSDAKTIKELREQLLHVHSAEMADHTQDDAEAQHPSR